MVPRIRLQVTILDPSIWFGLLFDVSFVYGVAVTLCLVRKLLRLNRSEYGFSCSSSSVFGSLNSSLAHLMPRSSHGLHWLYEYEFANKTKTAHKHMSILHTDFTLYSLVSRPSLVEFDRKILSEEKWSVEQKRKVKFKMKKNDSLRTRSAVAPVENRTHAYYPMTLNTLTMNYKRKHTQADKLHTHTHNLSLCSWRRV